MSTTTRVGTEQRFTEYGAGMVTEWERVPVLTVRAGDILKHDDGDHYVYGARDNGSHVVLSTGAGYLQAPHDVTVLRMIR